MRKFQMRGILQKTWSSTPQISQSLENMESLKNCHSQEQPLRRHDEEMEFGVLVSFLEKEKPLSKNSEKEVWTLENNNINIC